jgi:pyruvate/2-oxoglutarate dehydrogenase complex dihydrolipoamide acyltransferase (E2) component
VPIRHAYSPGSKPRFTLLAAGAVGMLLLAGCGTGPPATDNAAASTAPQTTAPATTVPVTTEPPATTAAVAPATVPSLVGQPAAQARAALAQQGLRVAVIYQRTTDHRAGTVIAQSAKAGTGVQPASVIVLTIAVAPPPPPPPPPTHAAPPPAPPAPPAPPVGNPPAKNCDPSYPTLCLDPNGGDYDCAGGSGNGPNYVRGPFKVLPPDRFRLDADHDGTGCE